jgi:hypothetical protein
MGKQKLYLLTILLFCCLLISGCGYRTPIERQKIKKDAKTFLENKYPDHDFEIEVKQNRGEFGFGLELHATDEEGIRFWINHLGNQFEDHYHEEWNKQHYGHDLKVYQDGLRDKYMTQMPYIASYNYDQYDTISFYRGDYNERFFESFEDALESSKYCSFSTKVVFTGIDFDTVDGDDLQTFAESMTDFLLRLHNETGYYDIYISDDNGHHFHYNETGDNTHETIMEAVINSIKRDQKYSKKNE